MATHLRTVKDEINGLFSLMLRDDDLVRRPQKPCGREALQHLPSHFFPPASQEKHFEFLDGFPRLLLQLKNKLEANNSANIKRAQDLVRDLKQ